MSGSTLWLDNLSSDTLDLLKRANKIASTHIDHTTKSVTLIAHPVFVNDLNQLLDQILDMSMTTYHTETGGVEVTLQPLVVEKQQPQQDNVWVERDDDEVVTNANGGSQSKIKLDWTLLPWGALVDVVKVLEAGASKYGVNNWQAITAHEQAQHRLHHAIASINADSQEERITHLTHEVCRALFEIHVLKFGVKSVDE